MGMMTTTGDIRIKELRLSYHTTGIPQPPDRILSPVQALPILLPLLEHEASEVLLILLLDTKGHLIAVHTVSRGTLDHALVHPREVFKAACLGNAATIITAHNHPSGDVTPSPDDQQLWARLNTAGEILGIPCVDHLIIGPGRYWSLREHQDAFLAAAKG